VDFLNKISVKFRIIALFIIFLVFFALFGLFTIKHINALGGLTRTMYEHPLQVSEASLHAKSGVLRMHRGMKDVSMATTQMGINLAIQTVQDEEKNVYKNLEIVKKRILGVEGEKLVKETIEMFAGWKPIRVEVEELVLKGNRVPAGKITRHKGADYVTKLERQMKELTGYAHAKAESFMATADDSQQQTTVMVVVSFCVVAIICLFLSLVVIHSILKSLGFLKDQMVTITSTKAMTPVEILGNNEITVLATHFNLLISAIKDQFWLRNNIDKINRELGGDISSDEMTDKCISIIAHSIDACAGAFYLFDDENGNCNLASSYAFIEKNYFARSFSLGEGIVGQVAKEKKPILLKNISRDDACTDTGTISEPPISVYVVPILYNMKLLAIMEVASFEPIDDMKMQFIDEAATAVASLLNNSLQNTKIRVLFDKSQAANDALQAQSSEINAQNEELNAINKELQAQAEELQAQASELETKRIQVEEADRLKSEFLSNMSHELRTPLNSIMSLSQLMISRGVDKDPGKSLEYLNVIDRNGRQLLNLINDILDLTKIESGRMDIFPTRFKTKQLVERIIETVHPLAQKKNLKFEMDVANAQPLFSDEEKVYQILLNCCSNAIKFTNKGVIRLTVKETGGTTSFTVKDTGIGIPAENIENIFDQFRQVDGSLTRTHEGTGLGLAISRKLALLLGGNIKVESTPGTGSTFTLNLPTNASGYPIQEKNRDIVAELVVPFMRKSGTSILVIDDEEDARATLSKYLNDGGYNVISASNGKQGLEMAKAAQPDIICLDLLMPDMDGWEVLRNLKSTPETVAIPVIISSISKVKDTGWALGAAGYVPKPIHNATLLREIQRISGPKPGARLLIADDDIAVLEFLKEFLGNKGYVIETADNGKKALEMVAVSPPQLLILDLLMPDIDGFSVLDQLRNSPETQDLPVIILTAKDLTENDFRHLTTSFKTIRKDKLNKENFLYQVKVALEGYDRTTLGLDTPPTSNQILVVDDNDIASEQIAAALMDSGFDVVVAKDGQQGLAHVQQNIPAGIVLDLMMPKIDGFQVLEQIRSKPQTATLPVLILTAKELTTAERGRLTHNNVQQLIQKGTADREQLVSSVKRMLSHAKETLVKPLSETIEANPRSILLVEDNPDNQLTISAILEDVDAELIVAEDGEEGVKVATEKIPNLILMDIQLPVMNGIEAIKILKDNPATNKIPIIVVTARAMKGNKENVLAAGANDYVSKPINPAELQEKVRKWMS
jgi:CheY-like chemotaxis protein/signal transduction histidine kinase